MAAEPFTAREREVLAAVCDALAPGLDEGPSASGLGVPAAVEEIVLTRFPPPKQRELRSLLALFGSGPALALLGSARVPFHRLSPEGRERLLLGWSTSRVAVKRQAFQGLKRLVLFLQYALAEGEARENPNWPAIGYALPDEKRLAAERAPPREPLRRARVEDGATLEADAVVVGSGAGGGVAAAVLARAGHSVIVVEAGAERDEDDFSAREADGMRDLYEGSGLFTTRDLAFTILAGATAGGGTTVNWMTSLAPPPRLREEWESLGVPDLTGDAFEACVREASRRVHVTLDESTVNGPNDALLRGAKALGMKMGDDYRILPRNALGCASRCQPCAFGCPYGAKQGTLVTYLRDAHDAGARFLFEARATRVLVDGGRATGVDVEARLPDGRVARVRVKARAVVVAAGAVHTAALLRRSGVRARNLGRVFLHPTTSVPALFPRPVRMWEGPVQTVAVTKFMDMDGRGRGAILESAPGHPGLSAVSLPWRGGRAHAETMRDVARTAGLIAITRDTDAGRVRVDARGAPIVEYKLSPRNAQHLLRGVQELARVERAAGATSIMTLHQSGLRVDADPVTGRIRDADFDDFLARVFRLGARPNDLGLFSAHQMGTAGMGRDGESVADGRGRVHSVEGLYVCDGSAFPTPSGVNPMLTILALALRNARFVAEDLRRAG